MMGPESSDIEFHQRDPNTDRRSFRISQSVSQSVSPCISLFLGLSSERLSTSQDHGAIRGGGFSCLPVPSLMGHKTFDANYPRLASTMRRGWDAAADLV